MISSLQGGIWGTIAQLGVGGAFAVVILIVVFYFQKANKPDASKTGNGNGNGKMMTEAEAKRIADLRELTVRVENLRELSELVESVQDSVKEIALKLSNNIAPDLKELRAVVLGANGTGGLAREVDSLRKRVHDISQFVRHD